jgi:hypothetical protein
LNPWQGHLWAHFFPSDFKCDYHFKYQVIENNYSSDESGAKIELINDKNRGKKNYRGAVASYPLMMMNDGAGVNVLNH